MCHVCCSASAPSACCLFLNLVELLIVFTALVHSEGWTVQYIVEHKQTNTITWDVVLLLGCHEKERETKPCQSKTHKQTHNLEDVLHKTGIK